MSFFEGIWIPLVTPFRDGAVDLDATQRLAVDFANSGVRGLVICGTTGEAATLSEAEQVSLLCAIQEAVPDCPVVFGVSGNDTRAVMARVARCNRYKVAGYLISAPAYVRPSQAGILRHFQEVAGVAAFPIIIYNVPARTGVDIELATVLTLASNPRFVALKQCGNDVLRVAEITGQSRLKFLCGEDMSMFAALCLGGHGAVSAAAHIRPDLYAAMFELIKAGELARARAIANVLLPLIRLLFSEPSPAPVKAALALQGRIRDELRLPMTPMSTVGKLRMTEALAEVMAFKLYV